MLGISSKAPSISRKGMKSGVLSGPYVYPLSLTSLYSYTCEDQFFFCLGFLSRAFMIHKTAGEGGGCLFNSSLPLPPASQILRH